ncbi:carbohydrate-binding protein [Fulvivirga ligni]|uniref:carbohydrate-binding protein n=1 Tax=Fulvivirga ligni TaxID=2904246 RepID=UPI001F325959|nr:carbohydrate-binding protein [Fulvivirga ligni]UII19636.1 carbohydrate-binding protein [Fulvivirga ligni]
MISSLNVGKAANGWSWVHVRWILALSVIICFSTFQSYGQYIVENLTPGTTIREGLSLAQAADGRIFIAERAGTVKVYQGGVTSTAFSVSTTTDSEQGLLGITLHPDFMSNGYMYVFYTRSDKYLHIIERIQLDNNNQEVGRQQIMTLDPIQGGFHNGGDLKFFNGYLFITVGDSQNSGNSQNLDTYRGKILRVTESGSPAPGNPFYGSGSVQKQSIWALGFRNPFRLVPNVKANKLFVLDVGTSWEEINDITDPSPQFNYAWGHPQGGDGNQTETDLFINPTFAFQTGSIGNAIANGLIYNPDVSRYPAVLYNKFIFKDYLRNEIRYFDWTQSNPGYTSFYNSPHRTALGMILGNDGYIYYCDYGNNGNLIRLKYGDEAEPEIINQPISQSVIEGESVSFSVDVSGAEPISYQWQYNNQDIAGATGSTYSISSAALSDAGNYRVVVSNSVGSATSNNAVLTVNEFNNHPEIDIIAPLASLMWDAEDNIYFEATATDVEDGVLPASAFSWSIDLFHEDVPGAGHSHPGASPQGVKSGNFIASSQGEKTPNIWYRFKLTVTDSDGLSATTFVDVHPNLITITATTVPEGLTIELNQKPGTSPEVQQAVVNANLQVLNAPTPQFIGNVRYDFDHWEHGGAANQTFTAPAVDATYTAFYTSSDVSQQPYEGVVAQIPGLIEAEKYDEGVGAYYDINGGGDGTFRTGDGVGTEACSEGGYNIGWVVDGEWLEYTTNVNQEGSYSIAFRMATPYDNRSLHVEVDDNDVTGNVALPNTGGFQSWQTASVSDVFLSAGSHIIKIYFEANDINLNSFEFIYDGDSGSAPVADFEASSQQTCVGTPVTFTSVSLGQIDSYSWNFGADATPATATGAGPHTVVYSTPATKTVELQVSNQAGSDSKIVTVLLEDCNSAQSPFGGSPAEIPGRVEAEEYDLDGEGIAYHDLSAGNAGGSFRDDDVDIQPAAGSNYNIGWVQAGEWLEYTVNVVQHDEYDFSFRVSTPYDGQTLHLEQNGENISGSVSIPNSAGYQNWQTVTVGDIHLHEGISELRLVFETNDVNIDYIDFYPSEEDTNPGGTANTLQAEDATVVGAVVANNQSGYNGSGFVDYINANNDYIEWSFVSAANEQFTLHFDYALQGGNRPLQVQINGDVMGVFDFPATGSWSTWQSVSVETMLIAGNNTIRLTAAGSSGPNVDQLRIEPQANAAARTFQNVGLDVSANGIIVYPNPSVGEFKLSKSAEWILYNVMGEELTSGNGRSIDVKSYPAGVYYVSFNDGKERVRVIKYN